MKFAQDKQIGLTIVGPEAPLVIGVVDAFREAGLKILAQFKAAAQLKVQRHSLKTSRSSQNSNGRISKLHRSRACLGVFV